MIRFTTTIALLLSFSVPVLAQDSGEAEEFDIEEAIRRIHRLMGKAEQTLLESARRREAAETGKETVKEIEKLLKGQRSTGKDIVEQINTLLDNLPRGGGGGGGHEKPQDPQQKQKEQDETKTDDKDPENSKKGEPKGKEDKQEPEQDLADKPPPDDGREETPVDLTKEWLKGLPPQLRKDLLNGNFERVPEKYRKLIEAWTKKMAKIDDDD